MAVMNKYSNDPLWIRLFGELWNQSEKFRDGLGAFILRKSDKKILMDGNAEFLLEHEKNMEFPEFCRAVTANSIAGLEIQCLDTDDDIIAGFVQAEIVCLHNNTAPFIPLLKKNELARKINQNNGKGLLILSDLEGVGDALVNTNHCMCAVNTLLDTVPDNCEVGIHSDKQLWIYVPDEKCNAEELLSSLKNAVEECTVYDLDGNVIDSRNVMTITSGYTFSGSIAAHKMFCASFALFEAKSAGRGTIREFSRENYNKSKEEYGKVNIFSQLIDLNLFKYHFQPIVSAGTGEIVAYEALMRTDASIGLNPLQILELAKKQDRLYDIERLTFSNVISSINDNPDVFESRKLFFNAISSHILTDEDFRKIIKDKGDTLNKLVIELTEQTEISDSSLSVVHDRISAQKMQLAIDDYGSGYSNTSNLIRYDPVYVKIDRSLISGIDSDTRKQNIVQSTIESLHANGYIALAEGVETSDELRTLIHMGVDLIQGFYLARPTQAIISEIPKNLRQEIEHINLEIGGEVKKVYHPSDNETVSIYRLALGKYTDIFVAHPNLILEGGSEQSAFIAVNIADNLETCITLRSVMLSSDNVEPVIRLGQGSRVKLNIEGNNELDHSGIYVPAGAELTLCGEGDLTINPDLFECYAIGTTRSVPYGNIYVDMTGKLNITANGDNCIAVGGGRNDNDSVICITGGEINIVCGCSSCVGIGSYSGGAKIIMNDCGVNMHMAAASGTAFGCLEGFVDIKADNFSSGVNISGNSVCGFGVLDKGNGSVSLENCRFRIEGHGKKIICIGTEDGELYCGVSKADTEMMAEGGMVTGIGDISGSGDVTVSNAKICMDFRTGSCCALGSEKGRLIFESSSKNIKLNE